MTTCMECTLNREESKSKYQKTRAERVGRSNACNTKKKNENCDKKARKNVHKDARPVHKMVAVTSGRPKVVAINFLREKYVSLFFRSVTLHSAKEKRNL